VLPINIPDYILGRFFNCKIFIHGCLNFCSSYWRKDNRKQHTIQGIIFKMPLIA
jgi:hypothetical membrane protein